MSVHLVFPFQVKKMNLKQRREFYLSMAERCFNNIEINKFKGIIHQENINLVADYFPEVITFFDKEWSSTTMNFNMTDPAKADFVMVGFLLLNAISYK